MSGSSPTHQQLTPAPGPLGHLARTQDMVNQSKTEEARIYNGEKTVSSTSGAKNTGQPQEK